jgi:hypothetical protein
MPLNGAAGNTEGGRLARKMNGSRMCYDGGNVSSDVGHCRVKDTIQHPITPTGNSRTLFMDATMNGTVLNYGGVTQERARQVLATAVLQGGLAESVRIAALQQKTVECSDDSPTLRPVIIAPCPPLPAPPGPPAPVCILAKNQKY